MTDATKSIRRIYAKGRLMLMQRGEFSDQSTVGLFRVLRDFDPAPTVEQYWAKHPPSWSDDRYLDDDGAAYIKMLIDDGWIEELEYDVLHTGCYGRLAI